MCICSPAKMAESSGSCGDATATVFLINRPLKRLCVKWVWLVEVQASCGGDRSASASMTQSRSWLISPRVTAPEQDASQPNLRGGQVLGVRERR